MCLSEHKAHHLEQQQKDKQIVAGGRVKNQINLEESHKNCLMA
jgi:hypothetical protein